MTLKPQFASQLLAAACCTLIASSVLLLASCAQQKTGNAQDAGKEQNGPGAPTAMNVSADAPDANASISARLSALGFHVFPDPVELPAFTAIALDPSGKPLDPDSFKGTVTLLNFWATWCPPCKRELPSIARLETLMKGSAFRIAAVSTGEKKETVASFLSKNGYAFPVYLDPDGSIGSAFASQGIPTTYIVDTKGRVVAGIVGSREYDESELVKILTELAGQ